MNCQPLDALRAALAAAARTADADALRRSLEETAEHSPSLTDRLLAQALLEVVPAPAAPDLHAEAEAFIDFATRCGTHRAVAHRKALDAMRFSRDHNARTLSIPSKLRGVKEHRERIEQYAARGLGYGVPLELVADGDRIVARAAGNEIGEVAGKYAAWLRPLLPYGLTCHVLQITGLDDPRKTPGVNVAFSHVTEAIGRFEADAERESAPQSAAEMQEMMSHLL